MDETVAVHDCATLKLPPHRNRIMTSDFISTRQHMNFALSLKVAFRRSQSIYLLLYIFPKATPRQSR